MTSPEEIDALAGEYVLGTLDPAERVTVSARRMREPALDAAIRRWEQRLAPLDQTTPAVSPPDDLFARIEKRIEEDSAGAATNVVVLQRRARRWKAAAIAASAVAASLALVIGVRETVYRDRPQTYVAVFAKDDILPAFYFTIDLKTRELTIRPVGAERQPGKSYQMWIASDRIGPAPRSLGLIDSDLTPTRKSLAAFDSDLLHKATFGVSLEPAGGSPTGQPTSPALHAKLLPVAR